MAETPMPNMLARVERMLFGSPVQFSELFIMQMTAEMEAAWLDGHTAGKGDVLAEVTGR